MMEFVYGKVPDDPVIPHTAIVMHPAHGNCELGDLLFLVVADLGRSPIPYVIIEMDTWLTLENPTLYTRQWFERNLMAILPLYTRGRN
jgi:hypothetical protein